jgi:hypothetical protein
MHHPTLHLEEQKNSVRFAEKRDIPSHATFSRGGIFPWAWPRCCRGSWPLDLHSGPLAAHGRHDLRRVRRFHIRVKPFTKTYSSKRAGSASMKHSPTPNNSIRSRSSVRPRSPACLWETNRPKLAVKWVAPLHFLAAISSGDISTLWPTSELSKLGGWGTGIRVSTRLRGSSH